MSCSPCSQQRLCSSSIVLPPQGICTCWSPRNVHPPAPTLLVFKSLLVRQSLNILFKSTPALLLLSCFVVFHNTNHYLTSYFTYFFLLSPHPRIWPAWESIFYLFSDMFSTSGTVPSIDSSPTVGWWTNKWVPVDNVTCMILWDVIRPVNDNIPLTCSCLEDFGFSS